MSDDVRIEILDGGLGLLPASGDEVHAVIGSCTLGTVASIVATRSIRNLIAARGQGTGIEAAAVAIQDTGKTVLFAKCATSVPGRIRRSDATAVAIASSTNATPIVVTTATPHGYVDGAVVEIEDHEVNLAANGTHKITVIDETSFSLDGVAGVGVGAATGNVRDTGVVSNADGTSVLTVAGDPIDSYDVQVGWLTGGTRGTAGAVFRYSLDDGRTWSPNIALGTATSYAIPNTGLTLQFGAGTFVAGDVHSFSTVEPSPSAADIVECIDALKASTQKFRLIHIPHVIDAADASTIALEVEALAKDYRYTRFLAPARDFDSAIDDDEPDWMANLEAEFSSFSSVRASITAGHYIVTSPISKRKYRRPLSWIAAARLMARPIQEHAGRVRTGRLKRCETATDGRVYHDERVSPGLDAARFFTARTRIGRPGVFVKSPRMMAPPGSDYQIWPHASVIDKACDITYEVLVDVVNDDLQLEPPGSDRAGKITEKEAKAIESRLRSAYSAGLTSKGACSSVSATVSRDDEIITTKTLTCATRLVPKGYVEAIENTIGFTNPELELE